MRLVLGLHQSGLLVLHMFNPDNEIAAFARFSCKRGLQEYNHWLILYFRKGELGKKAFSDIMNGGNAKEGYDIERAKAFLYRCS